MNDPATGSLVFSGLALLCGMVSSAFESDAPAQERASAVNLRSIAATLLVPAVFLNFGAAIADWPLAQAPSPDIQIHHAICCILASIAFSQTLPGRIRIHAHLISVVALCGLLTPLAMAMEHFLALFQPAYRDNGHFAALSVIASVFAFSCSQARRTYKDHPRAEAHPGDSDPIAIGALFSVFAWIFAGLGCTSTDAALVHAFASLLVATGTATATILSSSLACTGVISPRRLLQGVTAGTIAALPMVSVLPMRWGALAGLAGALAFFALDESLRKAPSAKGRYWTDGRRILHATSRERAMAAFLFILVLALVLKGFGPFQTGW